MAIQPKKAVGRAWRTTAAGARDSTLLSLLVLLLVVVVLLCLIARLEVEHTTASWWAGQICKDHFGQKCNDR